jgi:hypothetical protein
MQPPFAPSLDGRREATHFSNLGPTGERSQRPRVLRQASGVTRTLEDERHAGAVAVGRSTCRRDYCPATIRVPVKLPVPEDTTPPETVTVNVYVPES